MLFFIFALLLLQMENLGHYLAPILACVMLKGSAASLQFLLLVRAAKIHVPEDKNDPQYIRRASGRSESCLALAGL